VALYRSTYSDIVTSNLGEGFELLGVPCGSDTFIINWLHEYYTSKFVPAVDKVMNFPDVQVQFQYLYYVLLNKTNHLFRTLSPQLLCQHLIPQLDRSISTLFKEIFELDKITPIQWTQACLPLKQGGFGLGFTQDTAYCAYPASFLTASNQMLKLFSTQDILNSKLGTIFRESMTKLNDVLPTDEKPFDPQV